VARAEDVRDDDEDGLCSRAVGDKGPLKGVQAAGKAEKKVKKGPSSFSRAGARAGFAVLLRWTLEQQGATLSSGEPPSIVPVPAPGSAFVSLSTASVGPLLQRASAAETEQGQPSVAASLLSIWNKATPEVRRRLGVTPLFCVSHKPLQKLVRRFGCLPATVLMNGKGGGLRFPFTSVEFRRRLEGEDHKPGRFVNWSPKGVAWARRAGKVAQDGAGTRVLSRSWTDFWCWRPGAYHALGVPPSWTPAHDNACVLCGDPGVNLCMCFQYVAGLVRCLLVPLAREWLLCTTVLSSVHATPLRPSSPPPPRHTHTALCLLIRRRSGLATHPLIAPMLVCVCVPMCVCVQHG
jgi:hypothetical protein